MDNYEFCARWAREAGGRVLDYGCGAGSIVRKFREKGLEGFGCDVFYGGAAERTLDGLDADIRPHIRKIENGLIPFDDESFDAVTSNQVFEHVENLDVVLKEISRVLKPGGKLLAVFPDKALWREGHCGIPFLHWFPKRSQPRLYYAAILRALGAGLHKEDAPGVMAWSRYICDWLDKWTHYLPATELDRIFAKHFPRASRIELEWLSARLPGLPVHLVPGFVRRFATRRLICGRVMVAIK